MNFLVPSPEMVQTGLRQLSIAQLTELADRSGVPMSTLAKIRNGHTPSPGLATVSKFFHLLPPLGADTQQSEAA